MKFVNWVASTEASNLFSHANPNLHSSAAFKTKHLNFTIIQILK